MQVSSGQHVGVGGGVNDAGQYLPAKHIFWLFSEIWQKFCPCCLLYPSRTKKLLLPLPGIKSQILLKLPELHIAPLFPLLRSMKGNCLKLQCRPLTRKNVFLTLPFLLWASLIAFSCNCVCETSLSASVWRATRKSSVTLKWNPPPPPGWMQVYGRFFSNWEFRNPFFSFLKKHFPCCRLTQKKMSARPDFCGIHCKSSNSICHTCVARSCDGNPLCAQWIKLNVCRKRCIQKNPYYDNFGKGENS